MCHFGVLQQLYWCLAATLLAKKNYTLFSELSAPCIAVLRPLCIPVCVLTNTAQLCLTFLLAVAEVVFYRVYVPVSLSICQSVQLLSH